jgi:hypothetical protein
VCGDAGDALADAPEPTDDESALAFHAEFTEAATDAFTALDAIDDAVEDAAVWELRYLLNSIPAVFDASNSESVAWRARATVTRLDDVAALAVVEGADANLARPGLVTGDQFDRIGDLLDRLEVVLERVDAVC